MNVLDGATLPRGWNDLGELQQRLLNWFAQQGRDLPWRRTRDPYQILISEVMLQQTQVDRVIPKYGAFLNLFPTLNALAEASMADVIRAWAGLGYNRRAVNLQRTAQAVLREHGGVFPRDVAVLRALPGIGPYTAGALACFAFEQDVAFMDTNIRRVVRRVFVGPEADVVASEAELLAVAARVVPANQGWAWNQAIMELGALVCTAASPTCWRCPLRNHCHAYAVWRERDEQMFETRVLAEAPKLKRVVERRETPFAGSNRYYRGRIVDVLREVPLGASIALDDLGRRVKADYAEADEAWLCKLASRLADDGLIVFDGTHAHLPA